MAENSAFIDTIVRSISPINQLNTPQFEGKRPAAVLLPVIFDAGEWKLIFIHRSKYGPHHSDEVSFPGGGFEDRDLSLVETALREANEEIGISAESVDVLGFIEPIISVTNYIVTPIVGWVQWPQHLHISTHEVEKVFEVNIDWLAKPDNWYEKDVDLPGRGVVRSIFYNEIYGETIWGLTARITKLFLQRIKETAAI